jgi:hypothetical protein
MAFRHCQPGEAQGLFSQQKNGLSFETAAFFSG